MKKSLIALAVAGVVSAPAFAATSNVDVYGQIRMSMDYNDPASPSESNWTIADRVSRIGFKGSEDLGGGMKALWQIEQQLNIDTPDLAAAAGGHGDTMRNTFVGLSGGFGTMIIGRHDTPYKLGGSADLFGDTAADSQGATGIIGFKTGVGLGFDVRADNTLAYISPTVAGFHAAVAVIPGETATAGTTKNGLMDAYSLVAVYENGPLKATLSYENHDDLVAESAMKANVAFSMGSLKLGATYEKQSDVGGTANLESSAYLISAAYGMGPITLMAQLGDRDHDTAASDLTRYTVGVGYAMSKRTNVYAAYNSDDANGSDSSAITMGINHSF